METTKRIVHVRADGKIDIDAPVNIVFDKLTGEGGIIRPSQIAYEADKFVRLMGVAPGVAMTFFKACAHGGLTESEALEAIAGMYKREEHVSHAIIDAADRPALPFRESWEWDGARIRVNMDKARAKHMDDIRKARDKALVDSDVEMSKAQDNNDGPEQARLRNKRRALRDIPQTFDLSVYTTPDALKAAWPVELG